MSTKAELAAEIAELEEIQEFLDSLLPQLEAAIDTYDMSLAQTVSDYTKKVEKIERSARDLKETTKQKVIARRVVATA